MLQHGSHLLCAYQLCVYTGFSLSVKYTLGGLWEGVINSLCGCHVTLRLLLGAAVVTQYCCASALFQGTRGFTPSACCQLTQACGASREQSKFSISLLTVGSVMAPVSTLCTGAATQLFAHYTGRTSSSSLCCAASSVQCLYPRLACSSPLMRHLKGCILISCAKIGISAHLGIRWLPLVCWGSTCTLVYIQCRTGT